MRISRYHVVVPVPAAGEKRVLLFSTLTGGLCLLPARCYQEARSGRLADGVRRGLQEAGLLAAGDEEAAAFGYLEAINRCASRLRLFVVPGMACNFACVYCYEGKGKDGRRMDAATLDRVAAFALQRLADRGLSGLEVHFYGGEPLLYPDLLAELAGRLQAGCRRLGRDFSFSLVSNGSLLGRSVVERLLPLGLAGVKVTLDGPPAVHDLHRPFRDGRPSFAAILDRLHECCDLVSVSLGANFTRATYHRFPELLDILLAEGLGPERLGRIHFAAVMQVSAARDGYGFAGGCVSSGEAWVADATVMLHRAAAERGFRLPRIGPSPCAVEVEEAFAVHCNGDLYKCVAMVDRQGFRIGNVADAGPPQVRAAYHCGHFRHNARCRRCVYLPLCFGGCRLQSLERAGTAAAVDCRRGFYERALGPLLLIQAGLA